MRSCETSTQSLTPISWPTYLCSSFGWANSRFAIFPYPRPYLFCLAAARYHEIIQREQPSRVRESPRFAAQSIGQPFLLPVSNRGPFVANGSHLYRRGLLPIMPPTRMHRRTPPDGV